MTLTTILLVGGAVLIFWPVISRILGAPQQTRPASIDTLAAVLESGRRVPAVPVPIKTPPPSDPQTFEQALAALAAVRRRLADTDTADEATLAAIEKITQALVHGSAQ